MARQPLNMSGVNQLWQTLYWDDRGRPVLQVAAGQYVIHEPGKPIIIQNATHGIQLMCGLVYHPGPKAPPLVVCELCRHPPYRFPFRDQPRHGLTSLQYSAVCAGRGCGRRLCPRHAIAVTGNTYCPDCSTWARVRQLFTYILFRFEDE